MTVRDADIVADFRRMACELCGGRDSVCGHHLIRKGTGGGSQIDHRWNLLALCLRHHDWIHSRGSGGECRVPTRTQLWEIVAQRERLPQAEIEAVMWLVWRLPKAPSAREIRRELESLSVSERGLAERVLREIARHLPEQTRADLAA